MLVDGPLYQLELVRRTINQVSPRAESRKRRKSHRGRLAGTTRRH
jgi:hypothetical protein